MVSWAATSPGAAKPQTPTVRTIDYRRFARVPFMEAGQPYGAVNVNIRKQLTWSGSKGTRSAPRPPFSSTAPTIPGPPDPKTDPLNSNRATSDLEASAKERKLSRSSRPRSFRKSFGRMKFHFSRTNSVDTGGGLRQPSWYAPPQELETHPVLLPELHDSSVYELEGRFEYDPPCQETSLGTMHDQRLIDLPMSHQGWNPGSSFIAPNTASDSEWPAPLLNTNAIEQPCDQLYLRTNAQLLTPSPHSAEVSPVSEQGDGNPEQYCRRRGNHYDSVSLLAAPFTPVLATAQSSSRRSVTEQDLSDWTDTNAAMFDNIASAAHPRSYSFAEMSPPLTHGTCSPYSQSFPQTQPGYNSSCFSPHQRSMDTRGMYDLGGELADATGSSGPAHDTYQFPTFIHHQDKYGEVPPPIYSPIALDEELRWNCNIIEKEDPQDQHDQHDPGPEGTRSPFLACRPCNRIFKGKYAPGNLKRHNRQTHTKLSLATRLKNICRICKQAYKRPDAKRKHEWQKHGLPDTEPETRQKHNKDITQSSGNNRAL
ncbi:hypothetical protein BDV95DRAFT_596156 [Massariosphaeria phaeospora]|uniref:Uncharacterized protein n=1 Tax=Massariosphaeria phaeospora TaxID=100035 RepID=A0A7C8M493_9PLEO|nr:hypothetical protein BDV95DRAFT_596156 [Massariosphaeria phaeospora]